MVFCFPKVNVHVLPPHGGGDLLVLDRCTLVVDQVSTTFKAFDRESGELKMSFVISQITSIEKQYVKSTDGATVKGKTCLTMNAPIFVGSHASTRITLKMKNELLPIRILYCSPNYRYVIPDYATMNLKTLA